MKFRFSLLTNRRGATLVELMIMLLIVSLTLMTMFHILGQSMSFSQNTEARIRAINLAREGAEAMMNIRNTNYLRFSSDFTNCWNTLNYEQNCVGGNKTENNIISGEKYNIYQENGLWKLENITDTTTNNKDGTIWIDTNGWYVAKRKAGSQSDNLCKNIAIDGNASQENRNCKTIFTRIIDIASRDDDLEISSEVSWKQQNNTYTVKIPITLFNWKKQYEEEDSSTPANP